MVADVSREGVQRDLLPLIEGTTVATQHGPVKTDHILFIASGAFHLSKPSDLLPELQGRLPIRVELQPLGRDDFRRILTEPEASLIKQYVALMASEGLDPGLHRRRHRRDRPLAHEINSRVENIGARRLQTVMEKLLEEVSFAATDRSGDTVAIDAAFVGPPFGNLAANVDLSLHPVGVAVAGHLLSRRASAGDLDLQLADAVDMGVQPVAAAARAATPAGVPVKIRSPGCQLEQADR